jgi:hypothetical protein
VVRLSVIDTVNGIRDGYSRTVIPIVGGFNGLLTKLIPGYEELVIIAIAAFIGYKLKHKEYVIGGWDYFAKATVITYIILKILGFGMNPLNIFK